MNQNRDADGARATVLVLSGGRKRRPRLATAQRLWLGAAGIAAFLATAVVVVRI